jgi:hypothetical protein
MGVIIITTRSTVGMQTGRFTDGRSIRLRQHGTFLFFFPKKFTM